MRSLNTLLQDFEEAAAGGKIDTNSLRSFVAATSTKRINFSLCLLPHLENELEWIPPSIDFTKRVTNE